MTLRIARPEDGADIADIFAPFVANTVITFEEIPPTAADMSARIEKTLRTHPWLVVEENGKVVAYAYATQHRARASYRWSCDASVYVAETARRRGLARELYTQLFETLVKLGFSSVYAGITLPNAPSVRLHESIGFQLIGVYPRVGFKLGEWLDVGWWGRDLQTLSDTPAAPLLFGEYTELFAG